MIHHSFSNILVIHAEIKIKCKNWLELVIWSCDDKV
jgi:hypothetical protein